jgi:hypothetical protein
MHKTHPRLGCHFGTLVQTLGQYRRLRSAPTDATWRDCRGPLTKGFASVDSSRLIITPLVVATDDAGRGDADTRTCENRSAWVVDVWGVPDITQKISQFSSGLREGKNAAARANQSERERERERDKR